MAGTLVIDTLTDGSGNTTSATNAIRGSVKAWVALSLSGAAATIQKSYNVSSLTYVSTGQFNVNFTNALPDANYAVVGGGSWNSADGSAVCSVGAKGAGTKTTTSCACSCTYGGTYLDSSRASVAFFD